MPYLWVLKNSLASLLPLVSCVGYNLGCTTRCVSLFPSSLPYSYNGVQIGISLLYTIIFNPISPVLYFFLPFSAFLRSRVCVHILHSLPCDPFVPPSDSSLPSFEFNLYSRFFPWLEKPQRPCVLRVLITTTNKKNVVRVSKMQISFDKFNWQFYLRMSFPYAWQGSDASRCVLMISAPESTCTKPTLLHITSLLHISSKQSVRYGPKSTQNSTGRNV